MKKVTVGILAHVDAGKTTLAEALLFRAGAIRSQGRVDSKNSTLDTHFLEKERGITIFAGEAPFCLGELEITLLDTPGHVDFSAETERTLSVLDYAILVISAADGIQSHTLTVWKLLKAYGIPVFIFVTKCDLNRRKNAEILSELEKEFGAVITLGGSMDELERAATCDEVLLEEYLNSGALSQSSLARSIKIRRLFPCFFGSGLNGDGIDDFLKALEKYIICRDYPTEFGAKVYKICHDKTDRITKMRITGGTLKVKDVIEYGGKSEKINQIRIYSGAKYTSANEASAGSICAVTGLTETAAGQGLGIEKTLGESILQPVIRYRIVLPDGCDARQMLPKFKSLSEEDPKLNIIYNENLKEFYCSLMGKIQAEILKSIIYDRFDINVEIAEGKVIYKETVTDTVEGVGHYEPLRHYSEVHLLIEPAARGSGIILSTACSENELDRNWQRLVLTHLSEKTHVGTLTGSELTDVKITLVSGRAHIKHTEGGDFRQATYRALRQGLMQANSILLEPFYNFRLELPVKFLGRAVTDIKLMGGSFSPPENDGEIAILCGKAPVVTMDGYMVEVASYTSGMGRLSCSFSGYDICHNSDEVIAQIGYDAERDTDNPADSVFCAHGGGFLVKWNEVKSYMHLESFFSKKKDTDSVHRHISIDEKELEKILLKEFGEVKHELYRPAEKQSGLNSKTNLAAVKEKCLIIDGYNVIFDWASLAMLAKDDLEGARIKLCHILSNYAHFTQCRVIVVFDGYKVSGNVGEKYDFHGVSVVFTKENQTGDAYIEKLIAQIGKNEQVRVVTSDSLIQLSALHSGVYRMSSGEFEKEIDRVDAEIAAIIDKKR